VSVKYKTKNIKTDGKDVFLATINQTRASTSSSRNFRLTDIRLCIVWLLGSLVCPLKKMIRVVSAIIEKNGDKMAISLKDRLRPPSDTRKYPVPSNRIFKSNR
jgi:hypothetical protein